ncbi:hypothetical protein EAI89_21675 [Eubacterium sp. am_0171]|uniref:MBG domain-containing protein n=1 Tax=unclassified Eubacterium (in: firmicutes) TaxID=2624479 RepID=UPI00101E8FD6|nr:MULTISPECIES: MBG domain-containing protein [unclassified Eubacterium (in: firmicutes)]MSC86445.1 hypothetical protein [Eubacterium sp. BIOML-A1]MSD07267.1 hypothetical protein [Eubacterium sp. BIOML-A2]RYT11445.1 hypothetical protein EAI89_21675 [Eubacterium sp. am_0171]
MKTKNRLFAMLIALILMAGLFPVQAKAEKTKLIVTAIDQTYTYNGLIQGEGDTIYADPAQIAQKVRVEGLNAGDYISVVMIFSQGTEAGKYGITVGPMLGVRNSNNENVKDNYDIEFVTGTMTIEPAALTVTTGSASKAYDGMPLEEGTATIEGFIKNDTATVKATGSRTDAGTSDNTYEIEWGETKASNYKIVEKLGTLTVTPVEASITVYSASKMQGKADPDFTGSVEGLVAEGDLGEVEYVRIGTDEAPGDYAGVLDAVYKANPNYNVTVTKGNFTITPVTITGIKLNSDNAKKVYNEGDELDLASMKLEVSRSDGSKDTVAVTEDMVTGFDSGKTGKQIITVTYESFTDTCEVEVKAKTNPPTPPAISYAAKDSLGNTIQSVTWQKGSRNTMDITIKRSEDDSLTFGNFASLEIGGKTVDARYYTAAEGSLKLTVKPEYLETLSVGEHTIKVSFDDGSAAVKLKVLAANAGGNPEIDSGKPAPNTGDESNRALWSSIMLISLTVMVVLMLPTRKTKAEK